MIDQNNIDQEVRIRLLEKLSNNIDKRFNNLDANFDKIDLKFEKIDDKFDRIEVKFDHIYSKFDHIDSKFDALDAKFSHMYGTLVTKIDSNFKWLMGTILGQIIFLISMTFIKHQ